jgi:hypothetical protein
MILAHEQVAAPAHAGWRERVTVGAAVLGWLLVAAVIASRFVGHSSSPYGVCYAASGRSVPCALVRPNR